MLTFKSLNSMWQKPINNNNNSELAASLETYIDDET